MKFLLSGGGTAGHAYPALTVADALRADGHEVAFVGTSAGVEARLVPEAGIDFFTLPARGYDRSRPWTLFTGSAGIAVSALRAVALLGRLRPDCVIGFGGYVSIPVGVAAWLRRIPLVLQEQNSVPGLANRFLSRFAGAVAVTYEGSIARLARPERAVLTGNPVRREVLAADAARGREMLGLPPQRPVLLVFGGSRGARHINSATLAMHDRLMSIPGLHVVHVAGRAEAPAVLEALEGLPSEGPSRYHVREYIDDMGSAIAAADLVVARAGATSIAEITAIGRAAVLVPYPHATEDHQTLNAAAVADAGGAVVVADEELDTDAYADAVLGLICDPAERSAMAEASKALGRPGAAAYVARMAVSEAGRKGRG